MTVYQGEDGWGGPIRVLVEDGRPVRARCLVCATEWDLQELAADETGGRVLGPASCPNGCGTDEPETATTPRTAEQRAGFKPTGRQR